MASVTVTMPLCVNELLCYLTAHHGKATSKQLKTVLSNFYNEDEIQQAKEQLMKDVETVSPNLLHRIPKRKGENRSKMNVDDILDIYAVVDENVLVLQLPKYAAVDLFRLPDVKLEDIDIYNMAIKLEKLENKVHGLEGIINSRTIEVLLEDQDNTALLKPQLGHNSLASMQNRETRHEQPDIQVASSLSNDNAVNPSQRSADNSWVVVARKNQRMMTDVTFGGEGRRNPNGPTGGSGRLIKRAAQPAQSGRQLKRSEKIFGENTQPCAGAIRPVVPLTRKAVFHVDNISDDCTPEELTCYLNKNDIGVLTCFRVKSWVKCESGLPIAAYRVCVDAKFRDSILSPLLWPSGVTVRDWQFQHNNDGRTN
jgi:hypothetical protein